jgi:transposase
VVELREHQLRELGPGDAQQRLVHRDEALVDQLHGDAEGRLGGALADAGLQHPQLAALDRELDVAQVAVVASRGVP